MARKKPIGRIEQTRIDTHEAIRKHLGLETLETRKRDSLDFHDVSVASIRAIINMAFDAGLRAGDPIPKPPTDPQEILASLKILKQTGRKTGGVWVEGTIMGHSFEALVFAEHATDTSYELGTSRISKLFVQEHYTHLAVACFDRGWEVQPTNDLAKTITDLLAAGLAETVFGK